jgi:hypothetical protein
MPPSPTSDPLRRRMAVGVERTLQAAARALAHWRARRQADRHPPGAADLRGGRCHCPAELARHYVHSEGLREACDLVIDFGSNVRAPHRPSVPVAHTAAAAAQLAPGAVMHVKTELLDAFIAQVLPHVRSPFVLVTGDSDASAGARHEALLADPRLVHWFVQNCDRPGRHPRLTRIPIGLDNPVYTKFEKRLGFALTMALGRTPFDPSIQRNDIGDQVRLQAVAATLPPPAARPCRALATFHQNQKIIRPSLRDLPDRAEAWHALAQSPCCHFVSRRLRQEECWTRHGDFAFELSPRGNGLDCFRTWEALLLGTIPIVRTSTLDPLYEDEDLPVVIIRDWREVTATALARWREELGGKLAGVERRLLLSTWVDRIRKASPGASTR